MTHFRIIETKQSFPDVLIYRDIDEVGNEFVKIMAVGLVDDVDDTFVVEEARFQNHFTASEYIESFTQKNAENWCKRQGVSCP